MPATDTSITAYHETRSQRLIMCAQLEYLYREKGDMTDRDAATALGWHPSVVSARRNDLLSLIEEKGVKKDPTTHKTVKVWGVKRFQPEQKNLPF